MTYLGKLERRRKEDRLAWKARVVKLKREFERNYPDNRIVFVFLEDTAYFWKEK